MRTSPKEYRLLTGLGLMLAAGFAGIAIAAYLNTVNTLRTTLQRETLPLTGDLISAQIRASKPEVPLTFDDALVNNWLAPFAADVRRPGRRVYFTDATGKLPGDGYALRDTTGVQLIADRILNRNIKPTSLTYEAGPSTILLSSRYVPELDWYLIVEGNLTLETARSKRLLLLSLAIGAACTLFGLLLVAWGAGRYQQRIVRLAAADPLTGLANQQSFEILFDQSVRDMQRTANALSLIRFEIDALDRITDAEGHLHGEHVLYTVAQLANRVIRSNDIMARWSGAGFIILLRDCPLEVAQRAAETLRNAVATHGFDVATQITISAGVAECGLEELAVSLLARADQALAHAQAVSGNCVKVAPAAK
jgi:diguanylate cyclase (GGDEF)-like protein